MHYFKLQTVNNIMFNHYYLLLGLILLLLNALFMHLPLEVIALGHRKTVLFYT